MKQGEIDYMKNIGEESARGAYDKPFSHFTCSKNLVDMGLIMSLFLIGYYRIKKPVSADVLFARHNIKTGMLMGSVMATVLVCRIKAVELVDNPGFVSLVFFTDALWVILVYKLIGRREDSNIRAGLGIVASAALLVIIKSFL